MKLFYF